jgi:hypothetical protein
MPRRWRYFSFNPLFMLIGSSIRDGDTEVGEFEFDLLFSQPHLDQE